MELVKVLPFLMNYIKATVRDAIFEVFELEKKPLKVEDLTLLIIERGLYNFNTDQPEHIVRTRLRRDCEGLNFQSASTKKYFQLLQSGKYWLKDKPLPKKELRLVFHDHTDADIILDNYNKYLDQFKHSILDHLTSMDPYLFEVFCEKLLTHYGFKEAEVTRKSKDGGIDGFGSLKIGFTDLKVAFECKRWNKKIGYKEIRNFRGSIPEDCIYGIFFTTWFFTQSAKNESEKKGYKPVILMDGNDIVEVMIDKNFGISVFGELAVYRNDIDLIMNDE